MARWCCAGARAIACVGFIPDEPAPASPESSGSYDQFETDSAKLTPNAEDVVGRITKVMKEHPDLKVAVVGNTDDTGDFNYNVQLSDRRDPPEGRAQNRRVDLVLIR